METQKVDLKKKFEIDEIEFCPSPEKRNRPGFVDISPTLVIDTSMERSSRVLQHENPKIWFLFKKNMKLNFDLYFDLCQRAEIVQVGLKMNLYDDIGDASSSLRGSTSSLIFSFVSVPKQELAWGGPCCCYFQAVGGFHHGLHQGNPNPPWLCPSSSPHPLGRLCGAG